MPSSQWRQSSHPLPPDRCSRWEHQRLDIQVPLAGFLDTTIKFRPARFGMPSHTTMGSRSMHFRVSSWTLSESSSRSIFSSMAVMIVGGNCQ
ncbi:hypothetical protein BJX96DRAFT_8632 [Aspergillus floccosus]